MILGKKKKGFVIIIKRSDMNVIGRRPGISFACEKSGDIRKEVLVNITRKTIWKVYKLKKAIYGLKEAPRTRYNLIDAYFLKEDF